MSTKTFRRESIPFAEIPKALGELGLVQDATWAIATSPGECLLLRVGADGNLMAQDGARDINAFYEVTAFCEAWQAAFIRRGAEADWEVLDAGTGETIGQEYLVWGTARSDAQNGWCTLSDARVGALSIPAPDSLKQGQSLCLTACEHLERLDHGNAGIVRQRLTGLKVAGERASEKDGANV